MRLRSHIKTLGKRALEQSGKYPVNENDEEDFSPARCFARITAGSMVVAGLVPAIHVFPFARPKTWMPGTSPGMTTSLLVVGVE